MAEFRIRVAAGGRSRSELATDLRRVLDDLVAGEHGSHVRVEEWWDDEAPEVRVRATEGSRARWSVRVTDAGYEIVLRGPILLRLFRPPPLRAMLRGLTRRGRRP